MNCVEMIFDFMFDVFLSTWTCKQPLETNLDVGGSKFGFWGEKWFKTEKNCAELMTVCLSEPEVSCKRTATGSSSLKRNILRSSEMLSDNSPFFAFLCLFHPFLFWIGLWCKHEKVLDNFVSFPMDLVWLENALWILSYDENTSSGSWRNFKET